MIRKLDLYILKKFLLTYIFLMAGIMSIAIVFDLQERMEDFLGKDIPLSAIVVDYYMNFVFYYSNLLSFMILFIAVIFFTSRMASNSEIVAILGSGVSFYRMLVPYLIGATLLAVWSFSMNHYITPIANSARLDFENQYVWTHRATEREITKQYDDNVFLHLDSYNYTSNVGYNFKLEQFDGNNIHYLLNADFIRWDSTSSSWSVENYSERFIDGINERIRRGVKRDTVLQFTPDDINVDYIGIERLTTPKLKAFIENERKKGSDQIPWYEVELYARTAYPFATYILTLLGVAFASRKVRGGMGMNLAFGFICCMLYELIRKFSVVYATSAGLPALVAVWIPNIFFAVITIIIVRKAPK